jgi:hypothetical protein
MIKQPAVVSLTLLAVAVNAQAAAVVTEIPAVGGPFIGAVSSTDLLQTDLSGVSFTGTFNSGDGSVPPSSPASGVLTNGLFQINGGNPADNSQMVAPNDGATITFSLASPLGYNITQIDTYGGWNDNGRDRQTFSITYATVGAPGVFLPVDVINYEPANADGGISPVRATFTTSLTSVGALRFTFDAPQENGYAGYAEIDVTGTVVPEPGALTLVFLAALGLAANRRR